MLRGPLVQPVELVVGTARTARHAKLLTARTARLVHLSISRRVSCVLQASGASVALHSAGFVKLATHVQQVRGTAR